MCSILWSLRSVMAYRHKPVSSKCTLRCLLQCTETQTVIFNTIPQLWAHLSQVFDSILTVIYTNLALLSVCIGFRVQCFVWWQNIYSTLFFCCAIYWISRKSFIVTICHKQQVWPKLNASIKHKEVFKEVILPLSPVYFQPVRRDPFVPHKVQICTLTSMGAYWQKTFLLLTV